MKTGNDEFCMHCMDWREYDEQGRCVICRKVIKKNIQQHQMKSYDDYDQVDFNNESSYESQSGDE